MEGEEPQAPCLHVTTGHLSRVGGRPHPTNTNRDTFDSLLLCENCEDLLAPAQDSFVFPPGKEHIWQRELFFILFDALPSD